MSVFSARDEAAAADKSSKELFERPYTYLLRGDASFGVIGVSYMTAIATPDSMLSVETVAEGRKSVDSTTAFTESFVLHAGRPMVVRMTVADSTGASMIAFEFAKVEAGDYTLGAKGWPKSIREQVHGHGMSVVYFVVDKKYHGKFRFGVDAQDRFTHWHDQK